MVMQHKGLEVKEGLFIKIIDSFLKANFCNSFYAIFSTSFPIKELALPLTFN